MQQLAERWTRWGHSVFVLTRAMPGLPKHEKLGDVNIHRVIRTVDVGPAFGASFISSLIGQLVARRNQFDVAVAGQLPWEAVATGVVSRTLRKPTIAFAASTGPQGDVQQLLHAKGSYLLCGLARQNSSFVALSTQGYDELLQLGCQSERIVRSTNGVDLGRYQPVSEGDPARSRTVLFLSRLSSAKNPQVLLRAWKAINRGGGYRLLIAGDGPLAGELRQLAEATDLQDIEFLGQVNDVAAVHRRASVFVLPSPSEGCSNALLEAMASGLCPVVSRVPGNTDVVQDLTNGLLFDHDDEQQLADAVTRVLVDNPLRVRLAAAAREHVVHYHDLDKIAAELIELCGRLSTAKKPSPPIKRLQDLCVAVVGYGSIGRRHSDNLAKLGVSRRLVVRRQGTVNPTFTPPDDVQVMYSVQESIQAGIDLALICNPTALHIATAQEFFRAGVPILIEKPLAASLSQAERFVDDVEQSGVSAGMAYCLHYHPAYVMAREYVQQGKLGVIERAGAWFESYLPDWHPWEDYRQSYAARAELGGGVLPTLDHEIDFVLWCFGPPQSSSVQSWRSGTLDAGVDDSAKITMNYPAHVVDIDLSFCQRERRRGFEFVGNKATLSFSFEQQRLQIVDRETANKQTLWHEPEYDVNDMYLATLRDALNAIAAGRPLPVPLRAGLDALRVATVERNSFRSSDSKGTE